VAALRSAPDAARNCNENESLAKETALRRERLQVEHTADSSPRAPRRYPSQHAVEEFHFARSSEYSAPTTRRPSLAISDSENAEPCRR